MLRIQFHKMIYNNRQRSTLKRRTRSQVHLASILMIAIISISFHANMSAQVFDSTVFLKNYYHTENMVSREETIMKYNDSIYAFIKNNKLIKYLNNYRNVKVDGINTISMIYVGDVGTDGVGTRIYFKNGKNSEIFFGSPFQLSYLITENTIRVIVLDPPIWPGEINKLQVVLMDTVGNIQSRKNIYYHLSYLTPNNYSDKQITIDVKDSLYVSPGGESLLEWETNNYIGSVTNSIKTTSISKIIVDGICWNSVCIPSTYVRVIDNGQFSVAKDGCIICWVASND